MNIIGADTTGVAGEACNLFACEADLVVLIRLEQDRKQEALHTKNHTTFPLRLSDMMGLLQCLQSRLRLLSQELGLELNLGA